LLPLWSPEIYVRDFLTTDCIMLELDGSFGEGGGQILRTSLTLSLVLNQAKPPVVGGIIS